MKLGKIFITFLISLLACTLIYADDIELRAYVNKNVVEAGEQFILTIEISGSDSQRVSLPNPPDLSSFANYLGSDTSQSFQIINGRMSASKSSNSYYIAREVGKYQIPSVSISYKGKTYTTDVINIEVVKSTGSGRSQQSPSGTIPPQEEPLPQEASGENVFLQAEVNKKEVYVNQPVIVTFRLYTRVNITGYNIIKLPSLIGFWSEEFQMPDQIPTYEKIIDGKKYVVGEIRKLAVFPTEEGDKTIDPMEMELQVKIRAQRKFRSPFDSFFDEDFFSWRTIPVKVMSKPVLIKVKPLPQSGKPEEFAGAVGNFKMSTSIDKQDVNVNDAISFKVKLEGSGNIKMLQEPKIIFPQDLEKYEPKTNVKISRSGDEISGYKEFEYVLIPRLVGKYIIKPFKYSYFDPVAGVYKILTSPEYVINVAAGKGYEQFGLKGLSKEDIKVLGRDIRYIKLESSGFYRSGEYFYKRTFVYFILVMPLFALMIAVVYRIRMSALEGNIAYARSRKASQEAKKRLSYAKKIMKLDKQKEFYAEVSRALLGYVADKLNLSAAGLISDEVANQMKKYSVDDKLIDELMDILQKCDYQRFAPANSTLAEMQTIYQQAKNVIIKLENIKF